MKSVNGRHRMKGSLDRNGVHAIPSARGVSCSYGDCLMVARPGPSPVGLLPSTLASSSAGRRRWNLAGRGDVAFVQHKPAEPEEIASGVAMLASPRAGCISGSVIDIDAGLRNRR